MPSGDDENNATRRDITMFAIAAVFVGILIGDLNAALWSRGILNYTFVLYAITASLIPAAFAYGISARSSTTSANKFSVWFVMFCAAFLLLGMWRLHH